jgi:hypothetical protein
MLNVIALCGMSAALMQNVRLGATQSVTVGPEPDARLNCQTAQLPRRCHNCILRAKELRISSVNRCKEGER